MGRIKHERLVKFRYFPELIAHWEEQTPEFKTLCIEFGEPYGYSGQNVFLLFFLSYYSHQTAEETYQEYKRFL